MSHDSSKKHMKVLLFVAGDSPSSRRARRAIMTLMKENGDEIDPVLEIVDVLREPDRALESNLLATPTLIIHNGDEVSRYVGDLYDQEELATVLAVDE
ncbi:circadian clock KaiB family protein [Salinisphaera sp. SPP-AMP-43]|uniref:circadian clock KaiB family protein n=1 Tax=Salinisphaera sp. SPP-AMP-43 TaxID=3121288 RepID=UPI003C6DF841